MMDRCVVVLSQESGETSRLRPNQPKAGASEGTYLQDHNNSHPNRLILLNHFH